MVCDCYHVCWQHALLALIFPGVIVLGLFKLRFLTGVRAAGPGLVIVAAAVGATATFNQCGLPALPAFVGLGGIGSSSRQRIVVSLAVSAGAMSAALLFALLVAVIGLDGGKAAVAKSRWLQLAAGAVLIGVAVLHLTGRTGGMAFIWRVQGVGHRLWNAAAARPTPLGGYLFGVGFLAVGSS